MILPFTLLTLFVHWSASVPLDIFDDVIIMDGKGFKIFIKIKTNIFFKIVFKFSVFIESLSLSINNFENIKYIERLYTYYLNIIYFI